MVPILRDAIKVDVACCGNHGPPTPPPPTKVETNFGLDFDFGVDQLMYLVQQCRFPWLLANVFDPSRGGKVLGEAKQTHLLTASNGLKIGLMGLVERYLPLEEEGW